MFANIQETCFSALLMVLGWLSMGMWAKRKYEWQREVKLALSMLTSVRGPKMPNAG